jgi:hypothetical protein
MEVIFNNPYEFFPKSYSFSVFSQSALNFLNALPIEPGLNNAIIPYFVLCRPIRTKIIGTISVNCDGVEKGQKSTSTYWGNRHTK